MSGGHEAPATPDGRRLEVCVDSLDGALTAEGAGAHRIELCAALETDGLTPGPGLLRCVLDRVLVPVVVLLRPRDGGFHHASTELAVLEAEVHAAREAGAAGVALGPLTADDRVDTTATARLVAAAGGMPVTFHRAFDRVPDPDEALDQLMELGVARVLTSGGRPSAGEALDVLARLVDRAGERIVVMPGGGVRSAGLPELLAATGAREVHSSARTDGATTSAEEVAALARALAAAGDA